VETYHVQARNTAPDSENRIHDDRTAAAYGFHSGLVPGTTVYGYLVVPVVRVFGADWLARGGMQVRFLQPVYQGNEIIVELRENTVAARLHDGTVCATGEILWPDTPPPELALYPEKPLPADRPRPSALSLAPGVTLGTLHSMLSLPDRDFLAQQDETLPVYQDGILHPAALLSLSNQVLIQNVRLGPWIHAGSDLRHFSLARDGDNLAVRARVAELFERKGNRFVVLDVIVVAGGVRLVQHVRHTAIYEPKIKPASPASPSISPA
jgi:acyl dehydratase